MNELPEESELVAYVDGELPSARRRAIEQLLEGHGPLRERLEQIRALRILSRQVVRDSTPRASSDLKLKILGLGKSGNARRIKLRKIPRRVMRMRAGGRSMRRLAIAAAVLLCAGMGIAFMVWKNHNPSRTIIEGLTASGLTVQMVEALEARHLKCVMMGNNFEDASFPHQLGELDPAVRRYLGDLVESPDLSAIGLEFNGAGPCDIPGGKTLHWLYRNKTNPAINVSLFVQPFTGQVPFGIDKSIVIAGPAKKFPLLVWRSEKFVFFLIGDDFGATSQSAKRMGVSFGI